MVYSLQVRFKEGIRDSFAEGIKKKIIRDLGISIDDVKTTDFYVLDLDITQEEFENIKEEVFLDKLTQTFQENQDYDWLIEVGFLPGVTDNVGKTALQSIKDILKKKFSEDNAVYSFKRYFIKGNLSIENLNQIAKELSNEIVQHFRISKRGENLELIVPKVSLKHVPSVLKIDLNVSDEELQKISKTRSLALNLIEMKKLKEYFFNPSTLAEREKIGLSFPTDVELEVLAQTWSEHCKHKIFNAKVHYKENNKEEIIDSLFNTYIKKSTNELKEKLPWVVSTLWDNSGVMEFNKDWLFCFKCETHNSPSAIEPYGGAITGIVGVYRDPMGTGMGAKLVYGTYGFCTGSPFYSGILRPRFHPRRLLESVRKGVEDGGNKSGIPTPYGITFFDEGYIGKPGIYVLAAGMIPKKVGNEEGWKKKVDSRDFIVMIGGRVGKDGIHGATESSMEHGAWITAGHVQIGDPFTQKKVQDFVLEARDLGLYTGITDNGAGGLSSSVGEMAQFSGGCELHLDKVPLKYAGLDPWEILVSESQERMTLAVPKDKISKFRELAKKHDVEVSVLGEFNSSNRFLVLYQNQSVAFLDMSFMHSGVPQMELEAEWKTRDDVEESISEPPNHDEILKSILSRENIASKEYIIRQFDHEVQGTSVVKQLVGKEQDVCSDAVVIKPVFDSDSGIAISSGINPKYGLIDTYDMTSCNLDESIRRIIAVGGSLKQIALNDNFCWPSPLFDSVKNPEGKYKLAQLVRACKALYDSCSGFKTPCISGKDSMSMNGNIQGIDGREHRISSLPTLQFSAAGKIDDIKKCVTMDAKSAGDLVYVLGLTKDELGASEYYELKGLIGKNCPKVDISSSINLYNTLSRIMEKGLVNSVHGCYKGGLAIALSQTAFAGNLGMKIDLQKIPVQNLKRDDKILYSESPGRFVVTISLDKKEEFENILKINNCVFSEIGRVDQNDTFLVVGLKENVIINSNIKDLKEAWKKTFKDF